MNVVHLYRHGLDYWICLRGRFNIRVSVMLNGGKTSRTFSDAYRRLT